MCTVIARYDSGSGRAAKSSDVASADWIASRMSFTVTVLPPAMSAPREGAEGYVGVLLRVGGAVGSAVELRQRVVAREGACDAGVRDVRAGEPAGTARTPSTYGTPCHTARHCVPEVGLR
ncbi:hypothetical protein GCM10017779_34710 [Streptomyces capillispiralis]|nr:hypothetical protein GCM10017779_34710 [Streptomyces capillispiralis]